MGNVGGRLVSARSPVYLASGDDGNHVSSDQAEPNTTRPYASSGHDVDASDIWRHDVLLPRRVGSLLVREQHLIYCTAVVYHQENE